MLLSLFLPQNFKQNLDQFQAQVSGLETRLVSVLSRALEDCSEASSAAKVPVC